jgi:hypothetical protein
MWLDERLEMCDATSAAATAAATVLLGDQIDLSAAGRDVGAGEPMFWVIQVDTAFTSTGSPTAVFKLVSDDSTSISTTGGATEHVVTSAIAYDAMAVGYTKAISLPMESPVYERYLGTLVTAGGTGNLAAGKINSFITRDVAKWKAYAD